MEFFNTGLYGNEGVAIGGGWERGGLVKEERWREWGIYWGLFIW